MSFEIVSENKTPVRWLTVLKSGMKVVSVVARKYDDVWMIYLMSEGRTFKTIPCREEEAERIYQTRINQYLEGSA